MKNPINKFPRNLAFLLSVLCFISFSLIAFAVSYGDVNNDSSINIIDALLVAQYSAGLNPAVTITGAADVSGDGFINIIDALLIARYSAGLITQFPVISTTPTPTPANCSCQRIENGTVTERRLT